jgi:transcriptional regulator with XRE-family HTH domain
LTDSSTLDPAEVARRLAAEIEAQGLSLNALATKSGVARIVIRELLQASTRQRNPITLVKLALALGQSANWLGVVPPPTIPPGPGRRLYSARLARGWTLDDLAAASQVNRRTIHNLEHGAEGHARTWADLARALEVSVADLQGP